jgi:hypothetical protein
MTYSEIAGSLLDLCRTLAWPIVVVALAFGFKDQIKRAAERLIEFSPTGGAKFAPPIQEQIPPKPSDPLEAGTTIEHAEGPPPMTDQNLSHGSLLLQTFIANVRATVPDDVLLPAVDQLRPDVKSRLGDQPRDQVEGLIFSLSALNIHLTYEKNYQAIFGSQIRALAQMNTDFGSSRDALLAIFTAAKAAYPQLYGSYSFDQWLNWIQQSGLCTIGVNGNYVLTPNGRGFLKYLLDRHLFLEKAG